MKAPLRILVAENELGDIILLQKAFEEALVDAPVYFARDGQEVIDYLQGKSPFQNPVLYPLPSLLLLDLKLPVMDGFAVLEWVRAQPKLRRMIVVVFSSSDHRQDISRACLLGANWYIVKPQDPHELVAAIRQMRDYWQNISTQSELDAIPSRVLAVS
jgi:CheY-like chemotaxis protein